MLVLTARGHPLGQEQEMRITQQHKLIRLANNASEKVNLNRHDMRTLLQKVMEAKTVDEKLYSLEFLFDSINKAGE